MNDGNSAALKIYEEQQARMDEAADLAQEYREQAIDELAEEILSGHNDAVASLCEALCESSAGGDDVGNALDALAVLYRFCGKKSIRNEMLREETNAMNAVKSYVREYVESWSDKVDDRMHQIAGYDV